MPHVCIDEILAFLAIFPFIGIFFRKLHLWYHMKFKHKAHKHNHSVRNNMTRMEILECEQTHLRQDSEDLVIKK